MWTGFLKISMSLASLRLIPVLMCLSFVPSFCVSDLLVYMYMYFLASGFVTRATFSATDKILV